MHKADVAQEIADRQIASPVIVIAEQEDSHPVEEHHTGGAFECVARPTDRSALLRVLYRPVSYSKV